MTRKAMAQPSMPPRCHHFATALAALLLFTRLPTANAAPVTTLVVSDAAGGRGAVGVEVRITTTAAITVGATDVGLTFDPAVLQATQIDSQSLSSFNSFIDNEAGRVATASASGQGDTLAAGSVLFSVRFTVKGNAASGPSPLQVIDLDGVLPNDLSAPVPPIPAAAVEYAAQAGSFTVLSPSSTPTLPLPTATASATPRAETDIAADAATAPAGAAVTIAVRSSNAIAVGASDIGLRFNPTVLRADAALSDLSNFTFLLDNDAGQVNVVSASGSAGGDAVAAGGVLFSVRFTVIAAEGATSALTVIDLDGLPPDDLAGPSPPIPAPAIVFRTQAAEFRVAAQPTATRTVATPTPPTPTAVATDTPRRPLCVGDCNGDGSVTVDEILTMINIALGSSSITACDAGDQNADAQVTVDEIVQAVNNALAGCPS